MARALVQAGDAVTVERFDPARLRAEYESGLAMLLPTKECLADADWLIHQVVYRLYGLTEEDIGIVEGRGE